MTLKVKDLMSQNPVIIAPQTSLKSAAQKMKSLNIGLLLVGNKKNLKGVITDRDIVVRAASKGKDLNEEKVADYMSLSHYACNEEDTVEAASEKMHQHKVLRLIVRNKSGVVTGILSFGSLLKNDTSAQNVCDMVKSAYWHDFYEGDTRDKIFA